MGQSANTNDADAINTRSFGNTTDGNGMGGGETEMMRGTETGGKFTETVLVGEDGGENMNLVNIIISVLGGTITKIHSLAVIHNPKHYYTNIFPTQTIM